MDQKFNITFRDSATKKLIATVSMDRVPAVREILRFPKPEHEGGGYDMYEVEHMYTDFANTYDYHASHQTYVYLQKDPIYLPELY